MFNEKFSDFPKEVVEYFIKLVETKENSTHFRIAWVGDPDQLEAYAKVQRSGCCGQHDTVFVDEYGAMYLVGFNYGH